MSEYLPKYRAHIGENGYVEAPSLYDLRLYIAAFDENEQCSVSNMNGNVLFSGSVEHVSDEIHETIFPSPATKRDIQRLERQIQELRDSLVQGTLG